MSSDENIDALVSQLEDASISDDLYAFLDTLDTHQRDLLEEISSRFQCGKLGKVIVMAGAGISVSAGIPDFRTPGTGLYDNLQKYDLPYPEAIFELDFFKSNPKPFFDLASELWPGSFTPTPSHRFMKVLQDMKVLLRVFTQNIDGLERIAGVKPEMLVEAHGTFSSARCVSCKYEHSHEYIKEHIEVNRIPRCNDDKCKNWVKPDIVFFGENLPASFFTAISDFEECELLIVMGTSLQVHPFCKMIDLVPEDCPRILVNREEVGVDSLMFQRPLRFDKGKDVFLQGHCDDMVHRLAELFGIGTEMNQKVNEEIAKVGTISKLSIDK